MKNLKYCPQCDSYKPRTEFHKCKTRSDGLHGWCKVCRSAKQVERWADPEYQSREKARRKDKLQEPGELERGRKYKREWVKNRRDTDPEYRRRDNEREAKRMREKYRTDPAFRAYVSDYSKKRKTIPEVRERLNARSRARWHSDPSLRAKRRAYSHRYRHESTDGSFTAEDVAKQYKAQKGRCYYCGDKVGDTYHIDHVVPLARGGSNTPDNIVIACPVCNLSKADKMPHEWGKSSRLL